MSRGERGLSLAAIGEDEEEVVARRLRRRALVMMTASLLIRSRMEVRVVPKSKDVGTKSSSTAVEGRCRSWSEGATEVADWVGTQSAVGANLPFWALTRSSRRYATKRVVAKREKREKRKCVCVLFHLERPK